MIVLGADAHKRSHTIAAVEAATGQVLGDKTTAATARGFGLLLLWARSLDRDRVWALEDCRHVSGGLERFLIARGERVVRVSTRLMAGSRRSSRERGKSDRIDALSVARAALAAGLETLPTASLAGPELDLRLLVDHRERLVRARVALNSTLQWNPHDLWPELELRAGALFSAKWSRRISDVSRAPSRPCASGSPATNCAACVSSRRPSRRSKPRSPTSPDSSRPVCSPSPAADH